MIPQRRRRPPGPPALLLLVASLAVTGCGGSHEAKSPGESRKPAPASQAGGAGAQIGGRSTPDARTYSSSVGPDQVGKAMSLEQAYADYQPGKDDPELSSTKTGRRVVARHDVALNEGGATSLRHLLSQALEAVDAGDGQAAQRLSVTRGDFLRILWPEFPQSRPAAQVPGQDAWDLLNNRNMASFNRHMGDHVGTGLRLKAFKVGKVEEYENFRLLDDMTIEAETADHQPVTLDLIRTVVERKGRFKVYSTRD